MGLQEAIGNLKEYGNDMWLGRICWFGITNDIETPYNDFHKCILFNFNGIDIQPDLPPYPKPADIFNRACSNVQRKNIPAGKGEKYNYLLRPAGSDNSTIWRNLVREIIDTEGHKLSYIELGKVTFNRNTDEIVYIKNSDDTDQETSKIIKDILDYTTREANLMTVWSVNDCVRRFIMHRMEGIMLKRGVYYVTEKFSIPINALDTALNSLGPGLSFHFLPLLDDEKQREMIRESFETESLNDIAELLAQIGTIIKGKKSSGAGISTKRFVALQSEYARLHDRVINYSNLLDVKMSACTNQLEIMEKVLLELIGCVKA